MGSTSLDSSWQALIPLTTSSMTKLPGNSFMGTKNFLLLIPASLQILPIKSSCLESTEAEPGVVTAILPVRAKVGDVVRTRGSKPEALQSFPSAMNSIKWQVVNDLIVTLSTNVPTAL